MDIETLRNDGVTAPSNNSSVISLLTFGGQKCLLTGDAGIPALEHVAGDPLEAEGFVPGSLDLYPGAAPRQSKECRSGGPNRLLGDRVKHEPHGTGLRLGATQNPDAKHPSKKVINAFRRRGYPVHATQGKANDARRGITRSDGLDLHRLPCRSTTVVEESDRLDRGIPRRIRPQGEAHPRSLATLPVSAIVVTALGLRLNRRSQPLADCSPPLVVPSS